MTERPKIETLVNELTQDAVRAFITQFDHHCPVCGKDNFNFPGTTESKGRPLFTVSPVVEGFNEDGRISFVENRYVAPVLTVSCTTCGAEQSFSSATVADGVYKMKTGE